MKDVQDIFDADNDSGQTDTDASALSDHVSVRLENIQVHIEIHSEDQSLIYDAAGSISRAILKKTKCEMCTELLSAGKMEVQSINFDCIDARQEFIADVSRGGLLKPSDVVYITCMHAFVISKSIKNNYDAFNFLLDTSKPRYVFTKYFLNLIDESNCLTPITNSTSRSGHNFALYVPKVSDILFNVMAKNYVSEMNSSIHAGKKRNTGMDGKTANERKIRNFTSL